MISRLKLLPSIALVLATTTSFAIAHSIDEQNSSRPDGDQRHQRGPGFDQGDQGSSQGRPGDDRRGGPDSGEGRPDYDQGGPGSGQGRPQHRPRRSFESLDTDANSIITLDEFLAKPVGKSPSKHIRMDRDRDGLISLEEFTAQPTAPQGEADIDPEEVRACIADNADSDLPEEPDKEARFAEIDSNADGFIDPEEFETDNVNHATSRFYGTDSDSDGGVTEEELEAALSSNQERREIHKACVDEQRDLAELFD